MNQHRFSSIDSSMSEQEFDQLRKMIYAYSGIVIGPEKRSMMLSRIQKRVSALKLSSLSDYLVLVTGPSGLEERNMFISSLTTNHTSFFRERHHFALLTERIIPPLIDREGDIKIWSAGCSSGQEPYSIAISLLESCPTAISKVDILATDIDLSILQKARNAIFGSNEITGLQPDQLRRHFSPVSSSAMQGAVRANANLTSMIEFRRLNLNAHWLLTQQFDVIFFRNVAIYFDLKTQRSLWQKFHTCLRPDGWLLIGHSERVPADMYHMLCPSGITAYRKPN